jgi:multidrug efflux system membrane fusion protein
LHDQTIMPNAAVHRGAPNGVTSAFVYVVNADSTVAVRPIVLGVVDGERVAVTKGLDSGDVVVTEGGDRLRDGARVLLPAPTENGAPAKEGGSQKKRGQWQQGDGKNRRRRPDSGAAPNAPANEQPSAPK